MPRSSYANPEEINVLTSVVGVVCERYGFTDLRDREECAAQIMELFSRGITTREELLNRMGVIK